LAKYLRTYTVGNAETNVSHSVQGTQLLIQLQLSHSKHFYFISVFRCNSFCQVEKVLII